MVMPSPMPLRRPLSVLVVLLWSALAGACVATATERQPLTIVTTAGPQSFAVEVADTPETRRIGLMHREHLEPDHGMLFDFERPQRVSMWMRNTLIPLDMLFVDEAGRIIHIEHSAEPHSLQARGPEAPVLAVIELAGGIAESLGIAEGDTVRHRLFATPSTKDR